jgi:hypothetical protein
MNPSETGHIRSMQQALRLRTIEQARQSPAATMFAATGRRLYVIGDIDGRFRPRSNPYDLHAFGRPDPRDPLAGKLQGVWAQPVKGMDRYGYRIDQGDGSGSWALEDAEQFIQAFSYVSFQFQRGGLEAERVDFPAMDLPLLFSTLHLVNSGAAPVDVRVCFDVTFDLVDAWFTHIGPERNRGQEVCAEDDKLVARACIAPEQWAAAAACAQPVEWARVEPDGTGTLCCRAYLAPGASQTFTFGMAVASQGGAVEVRRLLADELPRAALHRAVRAQALQAFLAGGPRLITPDPALNAAFDLARANLFFLQAEAPALGRYFYAGLEMFPFWFSNDGAYSMAGLLLSGLQADACNHLRIGLARLQGGRVPHQISPSGRLVFPGNAQETPLWITGIWEAYRWTGDRAFLAEMFPAAWLAMFETVLGANDPDGDGYPSGPGMVEVEGMGEETLDSAAYTWQALGALSSMAIALGETEKAEMAARRAGVIAARFDADWWEEDSGVYAMSLDTPGNVRAHVPHWAVIVPLEVGLASTEYARRTFTSLRAHFLNRWGLKHTVGEDERVWTLPTALLSRAAYRYGEPELGAAMLKNIAAVLQAGSIGLFHELIPEGACFVQLWSAAAFLRGMVEDLLGVEVDAGQGRISVRPQLPQGWAYARLENLTVGRRIVNIDFKPGSAVIEPG